MSEPTPLLEPAPPQHFRALTIPAWLVILGVVAFLVWRTTTHAPAALPAFPTTARTRTAGFAVLVAGGGLFFIAMTGLSLLAVWAVLLVKRDIKWRLHVFPHHGGIYAETFALWMLLFIGTGFALSFFSLGRWQYLVSGVFESCTLVVLGWPVLRGVSWRRVRVDLGLYPGRIAGTEMLIGLGCYAAGMAMAFGSALLVFAIQKAFTGSVRPPVHPVMEKVIQADWVTLFQVIFVAAYVAPVVEETMFRGLLFRHLREATWRWGRWPSITVSAIVNSFLFAVIHPQGWLGVLPLMMLAIVFSLAREWRSSLLPSMVGHAVNNAMTTIVVLVMWGQRG